MLCLKSIMLHLRYGGNLCGSSQRNGKHSGQRHIKFKQRQLKFNNCHSDSHQCESKASGQSEGSCHSTFQTLKGKTSPAPRDSLSNSKRTLRITRSSASENFYVQNSSPEIHKRSFSRFGVRLWNEIPRRIRDLPKKEFKGEIRQLLLSIW